MKFFTPKPPNCILWILAFSLLIRLAYVLFLEGQIYGVGETESIYIQSSMKMIFHHLNPGLFFHGSLYFYLISFLYLCLSTFGKTIGWLSTDVDFLLLFLEKPAIFYLISRMFSVLVGVATIYFVYRLGKYLWNKKTGLLAAFLFSLIPISVTLGTKASGYTLTNLLIVISALWWLKFVKRPGFQAILKASVAFGLALSSDYYALFLIPFFVFTGLNRRKSINYPGYFLIFFATALVVFMIFNPYFILKPNLVWQSIAGQAHAAISENNQHNGMLRYISLLLSPPYIFITIFFVLGAYLAIKRNKFLSIGLISFPLLNIALFSFSKIQLEHYIFHSLPFISLVSASMIIIFMRLGKLNLIGSAVIIVCFILSGIGIYKPELYDRGGWAAKKWIERNVPVKTPVLLQAGTIPFAHSILFNVLYDPNDNTNEKLYFAVMELYRKNHPEQDYPFLTCTFIQSTIPLIALKKIEYVVLSEHDYDRAGAEWLAKNAKLIKTFSKFGDKWRIRIYKVLNVSLEEGCLTKSWW